MVDLDHAFSPLIDAPPVAPEPLEDLYLRLRARRKRRRLNRFVGGSALVIAVVVMGIALSIDSGTRVRTVAPAGDRSAIAPDSIVAATKDRLLELAPDGSLRRTLASLASDDSFEGLSLHPDRSQVFASVIHPDGGSSNCTKRVVEIRPGAAPRVVADGSAPAMSPDGSHLAFVRLERISDICYRTAIVVRDLKSDTDIVYELPPPGIPDGTPPELPLAWSPASNTIAFVDNDGARLLDLSAVGRTETRRLPTAAGRERLLLPTFLNAQEIIAVTGCCAGPGQVVQINLASGVRTDFLETDAAVVSMTPRGSGTVLFVTATERLFLGDESGQKLLHEGILAADAPPILTKPAGTSLQAAHLRAFEIAMKDGRVAALVGDRQMVITDAHDWEDGRGPGGGKVVGVVFKLALDPPASVDTIWPSHECRNNRLEGVSLHVVARSVAHPQVGVDVNARRVILIEPGTDAEATLEQVAGTSPFPPMLCQTGD